MEIDKKYINPTINTTTIPVTVTNVTDGDTIHVRLASGEERVVRFGGGINTPETSTTEGQVVKAWMENKLPIGSTVHLLDFVDNPIDINDGDPYGRWTYPVFFDDGSFSGSVLLEKGMGNLDYVDIAGRPNSLINRDALKNLYGTLHKKEKTEEIINKIDETNRIIDQARDSGWVNDGGKNIPGAMKIGAVWLAVPPSHITVSEVNDNDVIQTLRTPGDPKLKTGKQELRIEIEVFFPSMYDINMRLRPLLAQFQRAPFLPIENEHVRNLVYPDVIWSEPKNTNQIDEATGTMERVYTRSADKEMETGTFNHYGDDFLKKVHDEFIKRRDRLIVRRDKAIALRDSAKTEAERNHATSELKAINSLFPKLREDVIAIEMAKTEKPVGINEDIQLAVALRSASISSIPGYPEALQCNMVFSVFNYTPYSDDFSFIKDIEGAIKQIEYFASRDTLRLPQELREFTGRKMYKRPDVSVTKDLAQSEPFLAYIMPLLTGEAYKCDTKVLMHTEDIPSQSEQKESGFFFVPPENWLRPITTLTEMKRIDMEYEISEMSAEERSMLEDLYNQINLEKYPLFQKFLEPYMNISWQDGFKTTVWESLREITRVLTLKTLSERLKYAAEEMKNYQATTVMLPFAVYNSAKDTILIHANQQYPIETFLKILNSITGGPELIAQFQSAIKMKALMTYGFQNVYKFSFGEDKDTVITGISAAYDTKLATIPLASYSLPTFQYMGKSDWVVTLNLQTCNEAMKRILRSLSNKASQSRILRNRTLKSWWINRSNSIYLNPEKDANGIFKLLGINHVLFDSLVYETIKERPGWWNVTIRLLQSDLDLFLYESLLPINFYDKQILDDTRSAMMKAYTGLQDTSYAKVADQYPYLSKYVFEQMRSFVYQKSYKALYKQNNQPDVPPTNKVGGKVTGFLGQTVNQAHRISSKFGMRKHPVTARYMQHNGVDYAADMGTPVPASADGVIKFAGFLGDNGNLVVIEHTNKWESKYAHLSQIIVKAGQRVNKGDIIAYSGDTGLSSGPHLHYGVYHDGKKFDPLSPENPVPFTFDYVTPEIARTRGYNLSDQQVQDIIRSGMNSDVYRNTMTDVLHSLPHGGLDISPSFGPESYLMYDPNYHKISDRYKLYNGTTISEHEMLSNISNPKLSLKVFGASLYSKEVGPIYSMAEEFFFQTLATRYLMIAPKEAQKLLTDSGKAYDIKGVLPKWNITSRFGDTTYDMYSCYLDLNLPAYISGVLSTPADFFFKRFDHVMGFEMVEDRMKGIGESYQNVWKFQYVDGFQLDDAITEEDRDIISFTTSDIAAQKRYISELERKRELETDDEKRKNLQATIEELKKELQRVTNKRKEDLPASAKVYEKLTEAAKRVYERYSSVIDKDLSHEQRKALVANRSIFQVRNAMKFSMLYKLGGMQKSIEQQSTSMNSNEAFGISSQADRLGKMRQDMISQLLMFDQIPTEDLYGTVTPWSLGETDEILAHIKESYNTLRGRDKTASMERAYPTIKLYFIEEDAKEWNAFDDYYGYNAIESIDTIKSKNAATSLANINLSNQSRNLNDPYAVYAKEAVLADQTDMEQSMYSMYLREGVTVMIKAGYDNNPANLDTIFFGKVVSTNIGDRISIVAQGFGAELLSYINNGIATKKGYLSPMRTHGDVVLWAANTLDGMEHFGSMSMYERLGLVDTHAGSELYSAQKWRALDIVRKFHPIIDLYFKFAVYDPRFENVYLPYSKLCLMPLNQSLANMLSPSTTNTSPVNPLSVFLHTITGWIPKSEVYTSDTMSACRLPFEDTKGKSKPSILSAVIDGFMRHDLWSANTKGGGVGYIMSYPFGAMFTALKLVGYDTMTYNSTFDWRINDNENFWDLLNEICLYHNDYIVQILPYNDFIPGQARQTLYVGPRDGVYKYTDIFDTQEGFQRMVKDVNNRHKMMSLAMNFKQLTKYKEKMATAQKSFDKLQAKSSGGLTASESMEYVQLSHALKEAKELQTYIDQYSVIADASSDSSSAAVSLRSYDNITEESVRKSALETRAEIEGTLRAYSGNQLSDRLSGWFSALGKGNLNDHIKKIREERGDSTYNPTPEELAAQYMKLRYGSYLTRDEIDQKITSFENTGLLFSVDNPVDLIKVENGKKMAKYAGYTQVVNYHYIDSFTSIIQNDIRASAEELSNHVILKYPSNPDLSSDLTSREFFADDNIRGTNRRTHISQQINIDPWSALPISDDMLAWHYLKKLSPKKLYGELPRVYQVGYNVLANQMRTMYRGSVTVTGMPSVNIYDVCVSPDTNIFTPNGWVQIKDINKNDLVYSHLGKIRKVTNTFSRIPNEKVYEISPFGSLDKIKITGNHPVYAVKSSSIRDFKKPWKHIQRDKLQPEFIPVKDLSKGDYVLTPIPEYNDEISPHMARLLGYYLAEGTVIWHMRKSDKIGRDGNNLKSNLLLERKYKIPVGIQWSFNINETNLADEIDQALIGIGLKKARRYINKKKHSLTLISFNRGFTKYVVDCCGFGSHDKYIKIHPKKESSLQLLGAYFNGDGHQCTNKFAFRGSIKSATVSKNLARSIRLLLGSVGIVSRINKGKIQSIYRNNGNDVYILSISNKYAQTLIPYTKWEKFIPKKSGHYNEYSWIWSNYIVSPIKEIKEISYDGIVCNISVEGDESYICDMTAVHNCFINDLYANMFGPFEVETVKHHFSADGFTTELIPNAVVSYMNPGKVMEMALMEGLKLPFIGLDVINGSTLGVLSSLELGAGGVTMGAGMLGLLSPAAAIPFTLLGTALGAFGLYSSYRLWHWGIGKYMSRDIINLCGLWSHGVPMTAGMEGAYKDSITVHMRDDILAWADFEMMVTGD